MSLVKSKVSGACLCGGVRFSGLLASPDVCACHCSQCRIWSGHIWASFHLEMPQIEGSVRWFRSSDIAERGFCTECGSSMFWRRDGLDEVSVSAGAVANPTGLHLVDHIYVVDKGDYYGLGDGLPQSPGDGPDDAGLAQQ